MSQFTPRGAKRIKATVERSEKAYRNRPLQYETGARSGEGMPVHAKTGGSGIGAATSVTQMTSAVVTIWESDSAGALGATAITVTCWNKATTAIGANKHILMTPVAGVGYVCTWAEC